MPIPAGARLGPYEIVALLGVGGMGEVYRASDSRLGRSVAIKVLPERFAEDPERITRFEREARSASALSHSNVVAVYDFGRDGKNSYIVTELVEGGTLRNLLGRDHAPLPLKRLLDLAVQIAAGMAAAHEQGIVHRDLKPENILLTKSGEAKIADFGLAKLTEPPDALESQMPTWDKWNTSDGVVMGTVAYMSPEQASGQRVDFRSDQFAFGSILYEMLAGHAAFRRQTAPETLSAIIRDEPEPVASSNPSAPPPLAWIIERCLAKSPDDRYGSTRDLAHDLVRLRAAPSGPVSPMSSSGVAVPHRSGRKVWLPLAAALAGIAIAAALFFALRPAAPPPLYTRLTFRRGDVGQARFAPDGETILYDASWEDKPEQIFPTRTSDRDSTPLTLPSAAILATSQSGRVAIAIGPNVGIKFDHEGGTLAETSLTASAPRPLAEEVDTADYQPGSEKLAISRHGKIEFPIGKVLYDPGPGGAARGVRFSPEGDQIAFVEERLNLFSVALVDLAGHKKVLSSGWSDILGTLAWNRKTREVWFSGREGPRSGDPALHAVSLGGRQRLVASAPGILILEDVSADGRVLVTLNDWRVSTFFKSTEGGPARDLSGYYFSSAKGLSADGKTLLLDEDGVVYVRSTDGASPAVRLGEGYTQDVSPDGKWALAIPVSADRLLLYPTGPGELRKLEVGAVVCDSALWFPDGRRILIQGHKPGERSRLYVTSVAGDTPRAISPEGVDFGPISPDGKLVAGMNPAGVVSLYPTDASSPPRTVARIGPDESIAQWDSTGQFLFLLKGTRIDRLDLLNGREELWKVVDIAEPDYGVNFWEFLKITRDGRFYAFTRGRSSSRLFLVTGLQ